MGEAIYNEIYEDRIIKYTLNIPIGLYKRISHKTRKGTRYNGRKSTFIREILERECVNERPITMREFMQLERGAEITEPPRRFSGFIDGLLRNSFMWVQWRKKYLTKV